MVSRDAAGKAVLALWVGAVCLTMTLLSASHEAPFATPKVVPAAAGYLDALTGVANGWRLLHVVRQDCACSSDVARHLLERGRNARAAAEGVLFVGHDAALGERLRASGFAYAELDAGAVFATTGIEVAPTMVAVDPQGEVRYAGGYYARRERTQALDADILGQLIAGQTVAPLPSFGCAFSKRLQAAADPLGLKYAKEPSP
jgi:hypothetical protein